MKQLNITFALFSHGQKPIGGLKVIYEYANALVRRGHFVTIVHTPFSQRGNSSRRKMRNFLNWVGRSAGLYGGYSPKKWFQLDDKVRVLWRPTLHSSIFPRGDVVIATAWETSEWVASYPISKGEKFYLIQHDESTFEGVDPIRVRQTWTLPLRKIVIAKWLKNIADELNEPSIYIPNGLDFEKFKLEVPIESRNKFELIMLYHPFHWKGSQDGLDAVQMIHEKNPRVHLTLFGTGPAPNHLPSWVTYYQNPPQFRLRELYNSAAIFIGPSWAEGWPLPPAEAAQCGLARCLTDIGGHKEYANHEETALLSPMKRPELLAENLAKFLSDDELRIRIAKQGHKHIQQYSWDIAADRLEQALLGG